MFEDYRYSYADGLSIVKYHYKKKHLSTIRRFPDDVWNEVGHILPKEKPRNAKGHPAVPFKQVFDGILFVLRTGCQLKMLPKEYGSGSTCHRRFQQWVKQMYLRNYRSIINELKKADPEGLGRKNFRKWTQINNPST